MNIFKILSSNDGSINEPNVSSFLAYLLDPNENHGLNSKFLELFLRPIVLDNKEYYKELLYNNRVRDLSKNYEVKVQAEFTVTHTGEKQKNRDIDILIEIYNKNSIISLPQFSFCIENKIKDGAISKGDNQLFEEISGLTSYYKNQITNENQKFPLISFVFITPKKTKRAIAEFNELLSKLENCNFSIPCLHIIWSGEDNDEDNVAITSLLKDILQYESIGEIEPIYEYTKHTLKSFLSFIKSDFQSYLAEKTEIIERRNYGKPLLSYFQEIYDSLDFEEEIELSQIKEMVLNNVVSNCNTEVNKATLYAHSISTIVNEKNRKHHISKILKKDNLFYYPSELNKKVVKKLNFDSPPEGIKIYWGDKSDKDAYCFLTDIYPEN
ncbi:PD-(D/E)XK nuclease family protein [Paenibacillus sp. N3.4]|uniref:PD-(D/E)XK nuclease family protein n=1 Tax=Paenibacillus sp. N3.4 TaxID=2603222 RepID=UPI0011CA5336|nr:PD-(D/E)XK nuclease family protein [Paenibacillus sp. N3.4]TXK83458.1 hypothetical protein FU659_13800 [Paenibacillus sp. N3.4]